MTRLALPLLALVLHGPVHAQDYPTRPIRVIVPTAPGGITDGFVQLIGEALRAAWGQAVVMEHRPGAGGIIGTDAVAKAAPDGYTLLAGNIGPLAIAPYLQQGKVPYDPGRDFVPVKLLATFSNVLVVNPSVQARNIDELIRLAKAKPGTLHFASPGIGQSQHLSGELFKRLAGVDLVHVPYKGTGPALTDLIGGQVQMMFSNIPPALPHIAAGKLRPLGVTSAARNASLPEVPTVAESGLAGYQVLSWIGLFAPTGTPPLNRGPLARRSHARAGVARGQGTLRSCRRRHWHRVGTRLRSLRSRRACEVECAHPRGEHPRRVGPAGANTNAIARGWRRRPHQPSWKERPT